MGDLTTLKGQIAAWQERMSAMAREREAEAQARHAARMAKLPEGTCATCYGEQFVPHRYTAPDGPLTERCMTCNPPIPHAFGVPVEFQKARFDNYTEEDGNKSALAKARAFLTGTRDLYLTGGVGAGKTRLACTIANESYLARKGGYFMRVPYLLHRMQPGREDSNALVALEQVMFTTPLLVLDDLGAERDQATDYTRRTLLMIYEERGDRGLRTIWTGNKSLNELGGMMADDRLTSRIGGRADVVKLTTPDQRMARRAR